MEVINIAEAMRGKKLIIFQSDKGGEFRNSKLLEKSKKNRIVMKQIIPYHSQMNSVAERSNSTILTMIRTMLPVTNLAKQLWSEAGKHAIYQKSPPS
jgi:transposase InsO family protein